MRVAATNNTSYGLSQDFRTRIAVAQPSEDLRREFGDIDIYLFDQLHRGRIAEGMKVLDAGCGAGRNLVYLQRRGFDVWGTDGDEHAKNCER